ncbi:hypothetical protein I316_00973 [Kwoniella heveanensis BCC8398]|uniref:Uncharacterized protein n=1 Tax=Kwoniella heveanensis BCC8398 TaxID=1296120 RepID=A0A1B9H1B0_9TREE|nr:hypothetical protein I316_00973 [Kwoniella heveanensis BCC8398]
MSSSPFTSMFSKSSRTRDSFRLYGSSAPPSQSVSNPLSDKINESVQVLLSRVSIPSITLDDKIHLAHARSGKSEILGSYLQREPGLISRLTGLREGPRNFRYEVEVADAAGTVLKYIQSTYQIDKDGWTNIDLGPPVCPDGDHALTRSSLADAHITASPSEDTALGAGSKAASQL